MSETDHERRRTSSPPTCSARWSPSEAAALERHSPAAPSATTSCAGWSRRSTPCPSRSSGSSPRASCAHASSPRPARRRRSRRGRGPAAALPWAAPAAPGAGLAALALIAVAVGVYAGGGDSGGGVAASTVVAGRPPGVGRDDGPRRRRGDAAPRPTSTRCRKTGSSRPGCGATATSSRSRGLFVPDSEGRATTRIPDMRGVEVVMVTAEPRGGSEAPTSAPMVKEQNAG